MQTLRIGVLGAARITKGALLTPANKLADVSVDAIGARDSGRAAAYAEKHGIPRVHAGYQAVLDDPEIDAIYVPLPAALHGAWTLAALDAGKHVLVEKPFTANAEEARVVAEAGERSGLVLMEAFHSLYHPIVGQLRALLDSRALGELRSARATFAVPIPPGKDIRWNESLGGGALMDVGCYPVRMLQALFGYDATVLEARATTRGGVDASMVATLAFPGIPTATITSSMWSLKALGSVLELTGSTGSLRVTWPYHPQMGGRIRLRTASGTTTERADRTSTYELQLRAFRDAVLLGTPISSGPAESIAMMAVIDEIYRRSGMQPRQPLRP